MAYGFAQAFGQEPGFGPDGARHGWKTLLLGAGGNVTGAHIANDGSMVCRTDVGNIYRWSGVEADYLNPAKRWIPLITYASVGSTAVPSDYIGGWEHVLAPGSSNVHVAIFPDMANAPGNKNWIWYSLDSGAHWTQTNIAFLNGSASSNGAGLGASTYWKNTFTRLPLIRRMLLSLIAGCPLAAVILPGPTRRSKRRAAAAQLLRRGFR